MNPSNPTTNHSPSSHGDVAARMAERVALPAASAPAMGALVDDLARARTDLGPAVTETAERVGSAARDSAARVGVQARQLRAEGTEYVRARPLQSVLIAAGVGAAVALVWRWMGRAARRGD